MSAMSRIRRLLRAAIRTLPERIAVHLYPREYRYDPRDVPPAPPLLNAPRRVLIGSTNFAAQGYLASIHR